MIQEGRGGIVVVGGGAAGIFAALGAAHEAQARKLRTSIVLLERNERLGIKILISGGGKCNITHAGPVDKVLKEGFLFNNEMRFLKFAMHEYTNDDVLSLLERQGVHWHTRDNGRIFPNTGSAEHVLEAFERELAEKKINVETSSRVIGIESADEQWEVITAHERLNAGAVIIATGGISYSKVGTTGDGITYARKLGKRIEPLMSALAPIYLKRKPPTELQGVAIRGGQLHLSRNSLKLHSKKGDFLFTHRGLSGPAALDISRNAAIALLEGPLDLSASLIDIADEKLRQDLKELQETRGAQQLSTWLEEVLPNRIVPYVLTAAIIDERQRWNQLDKESRQRLFTALINFPFGEIEEVPIERGEVTAGGVSLEELDPKTMMSKKLPGLFIAGEMLDVAGEIGGFNLQAAYSTGWVAGRSAVRFLKPSID